MPPRRYRAGSIQALEDELGVALLIRNSRPVRLTEAGRLFYEQALQVLGRVEQMRAATRRVGLNQNSVLSIGFVASTLYGGLPSLVRKLRHRTPDIEIDLRVSTWGPSRPVAEAVVGYLRAVGIRATVDVLTLGAYRKKQVEGGLQALVSNYVYGGLPDTGAVGDFFFSSAERDYFGNPRLGEFTREANSTLDDAKRKNLFRKTFDIVEDEALILPIDLVHAGAVEALVEEHAACAVDDVEALLLLQILLGGGGGVPVRGVRLGVFECLVHVRPPSAGSCMGPFQHFVKVID